MKSNPVCFRPMDLLSDIKGVMDEHRFRSYPVVENNKLVGIVSSDEIMLPEREKVILVDHNEKTQAIEGFEKADILEIIDHHRIGSIETASPIFFRNIPVGCTATIVFHMFREAKVEIPRHIAGLLLSAILSDTLMFRSPTSTIVDEAAAKELAGLAEVEIEDYASAMFEAGGNIEGKSAHEVFMQDFKVFKSGDVRYGVGQGSYMSENNLTAAKELLLPYLPEVSRELMLTDAFFMLTDVRAETTYLLYHGADAEELVRIGFPDAAVSDGIAVLPGVVSRKKQVLPALVSALAQI